MTTKALSITRRPDRPVDPWTLLTGSSVGLVAGFAIDLVRLALHEAKRAIAARHGAVAARRWPCPGTCNAGSR